MTCGSGLPTAMQPDSHFLKFIKKDQIFRDWIIFLFFHLFPFNGSHETVLSYHQFDRSSFFMSRLSNRGSCNPRGQRLDCNFPASLSFTAYRG